MSRAHPARPRPRGATRRQLVGVTLQWVVVLAGITVAAVLMTRDGVDAAESGPPQLDEADMRRGGMLYAMNCAACHGEAGQGGPGPGLLAGPAVDDIEVAFADLVIRTGRMPIVTREAGLVRDPRLDDTDRGQIVAWMADRFDLDGDVPDVPDGDPTRGRVLFNEHCAACHTTTGEGGVAGGGVIVPSARDVDRIATFSASRVGPFDMPAFGEAVLSDEDLADIGTAVEVMDRTPPSLLAVGDVTHVSGTILAAIAVTVLLGLVGLIAKLPRITPASEEEFELHDEQEGGRRGG